MASATPQALQSQSTQNEGTLTAEAVDPGQPAPGIRAPSSHSTSRVFLPPLEAATASTEKEPRNPTPARVGLTQRAALGSPLCHPFRGKSGERVAFQNRRAVHLGHSPNLPRGEAPERAGRPVPSSTRRQPLLAPRRPRGSGPKAQAPVHRRRLCPSPPPAPPPPRSCGLVLGLLVLPCLWPGPCPHPLWLHSRNHLGCRPPHPQPCSKRPLCLAFSQGLLTPPTPQPTTGAAFITRPPSPIRAPRATNRMMAAYTF